MTEEGERALLDEYLATCDKLYKSFAETVRLVDHALPVAVQDVDRLAFTDESYVLAYLKRFEQLADTLHRTLEAISKVMEHGKIERLTSVDVTRRAHALGIVSSEKVWADAVRARNALAHEYPLNPAKRAEQVNAAWAARETLFVTWRSIERFVAEEGLLG